MTRKEKVAAHKVATVKEFVLEGQRATNAVHTVRFIETLLTKRIAARPQETKFLRTCADDAIIHLQEVDRA